MKFERTTGIATSILFVVGSSEAQAQTVAAPPAAPFSVAQASDTELTCPQIAMEISKVATVIAGAAAQRSISAAIPTATAATAPATGDAQVDAALAAAARSTPGGLEAIGRQYQQAQNMQQLGQLQAQAAAAGIGRGTATAAIGGLAAMQQMAANGGHVDEAAASLASDTASKEFAKRVPGGALIGGMMGGMFKRKKKAVPPAAVTTEAPPAIALMPLAQQRLTFLQSLMTSKHCS